MKWTLHLLLAGLAACAADPSLTYEAKPTGDEGCVGVNCTGNSPLYAALGIFELSANPMETSVRGFSIDQENVYLYPSVGPAHKLLNFHVEGLTLNAFDTVTASWLLPLQFNDVRVRIVHQSGAAYDLQISNPLTTTFYAPLPGVLPFYAYEIRYRPAVPEDTKPTWEDLCPYPDPFENGQQGTWAVFWRGDRLDPDTGIFHTHGEAVGAWFNISCAGEAPGKVVRTGATYAAIATTTKSQAQAALDMFTARYCTNTSTRYTKLGTYIDWDDKTHSNALPSPTTYEAIWNGNGAYCLRTPRISPRLVGPYGCTPRPCTDDELKHWTLYGEVRSGF